MTPCDFPFSPTGTTGEPHVINVINVINAINVINVIQEKLRMAFSLMWYPPVPCGENT